MPVAAGIDEQAVVHLLDLCTKRGLNVLLRVKGYLLEFIDGEEAGLFGIFKIVEDLFQRKLRGMDVSQFDVEPGCIGERVVTQAAGQGMETGKEFVQRGFSFRYQHRIDFLAQEQDELVQAGCRIDVRIEGIIGVLDGGLFEYVTDQLRLSHPSGRSQQDVRPVFQRAHHPGSLSSPVAEIGFRNDAGDVERVLHKLVICAKISTITQLYKSYNRNPIIIVHSMLYARARGRRYIHRSRVLRSLRPARTVCRRPSWRCCCRGGCCRRGRGR